jgi:hypothetical protein
MKALQPLRALKRVSPMSNMSVANRIINNITGDSVSKNKTELEDAIEVMEKSHNARLYAGGPKGRTTPRCRACGSPSKNSSKSQLLCQTCGSPELR